LISSFSLGKIGIPWKNGVPKLALSMICFTVLSLNGSCFAGHFIQHCPTNGDARYDVKRMKPPTGIPKSMLMQTPDGSYALPSGAGAVLKPNE
jgi:hypothetical protein